MAGIDNNTLLYLRGDSFMDLSPYNCELINIGKQTIKDTTFGKAISMNEYTTDKISINNNMTFEGDFTFESYVYLNTFGSTKTYLVSSDTASGSKHYLGISVNGYLNAGIHNGTTHTFEGATIQKNKWHHIAFVRKNGVIYGYIDGKFINKISLSETFNFLANKFAIHGGTGVTYDICNFRISNVARYTQDFAPPIQLFSSIDINITKQTEDIIDFNISKLGREVINKAEVLVNNVVSKTYNNIGDLTYNIDTNLCYIGDNNKIIIRVTYDDNYVEEEILTHNYRPNELSNLSKLKDVVERYDLLNNETGKLNKQLADILINKNVEVKEDEYKLGALIEKVDLLKEAIKLLYLYKAGDSEGAIVKYIYGGISSNPSTFDSDKTNVYVPGGSIGLGVRSSETIDLTHYSKLHIEGRNVVGNTCSIMLSKNTNIVSNGITLGDLKSTSKVTMSFDISNYNDDYYIGIYQNGDLGVRQNYIYNIWLEP